MDTKEIQEAVEKIQRFKMCLDGYIGDKISLKVTAEDLQTLLQVAQEYLKLKERISVDMLTKIELPYPATFTKASPDGIVNEITLSFEAAQAIKQHLGEE